MVDSQKTAKTRCQLFSDIRTNTQGLARVGQFYAIRASHFNSPLTKLPTRLPCTIHPNMDFIICRYEVRTLQESMLWHITLRSVLWCHIWTVLTSCQDCRVH